MFVCNAFVLVFQILAWTIMDYYSLLLFHGFWGFPLSIFAASFGLAAAKRIEYKCLLQAHAVMVCFNIFRTYTMRFSQCVVSGIKLIIPIVTGMVLNTSDINCFQFVMNIFMLGLLE